MDKIAVTSPGEISERLWGISSDVPLAGGAWVAEHSHGGTVEAVATHAVLNEPSSYRVSPPASQWELHITENGFIASDALTGIFGFGSEPIEAIQDLATALVEHRDVLERQEALSPALQDQLDYLRDLL
ncbi:MAG: hypothetical protein ACJ75T_02330 [Solirubrobacterales bacterium]